MKLAMKLRTRLFLSISALITVALLGLVLGLVSVMQMAKTQESLIRSNFLTLELGLKLRQSLGDQLIMMLEERPEPGALQASKQRYFDLLDQGIAHEQRDGRGTGFSQARGDYQNLLEAFDESQQPAPPPGSKEKLTETFNVLRNGLISQHKLALENISNSEHQSRERALLIAVCLLALIVELLNSAIEAVVDRISLDLHPLSKNAKDMGSAAQFVVLTMIAVVWAVILL